MRKKQEVEKIFLEAEDDIDEVLARMEGLAGSEVVLNIPKSSILGESVKAFRYLKKQAREMGKALSVESVDDHVLELADVAGLQAFNPVFQTRGRAVVDIVPGTQKDADASPRRPRIDAEQEEEEDDRETEKQRNRKTERFDEAPKVRHFWERSEGREEEEEEAGVGMGEQARVFVSRFGTLFSGKRSSRSPRLMVRFAVLGVAVLALGWIGVGVLPKATVRLSLKRYPVSFARSVKADTETPVPSIAGETIFLPGELLISKKNMEKSFPASGEEEVEREATGKLTIFNEFSSKTQTLVARTRFETPDGKVFRLFEQVTVPGAKVEGGKIEASSIEVEVYADKAGEEYNIGPVEKFTIPGFQGDPRYEGFYGRSASAMRGGARGLLPVPTEEDLDAARDEVKGALLSALEGELNILMADSFEVLPGSTAFSVTKEEVFPPTDGEKTFSLFMEAELRQFVFKRTHLEEMVVTDARGSLEEGVEFRVDGLSFAMEAPALDLEAQRAEFSAEGEVVFVAEVDTSGLRGELLGKRADEVKQAIFKLPGLERANVSLWPFWVKKVPESEKKVEIVVE